MAKNIYLYEFDGSVRRNKRQEAIFKDLAQKDDFLKRIANERAERQLLSKKKAAALKIQAAFRSFYERKQVFACLRDKFDAVGKTEKLEVLELQIGRLSFFFNRIEDIHRTVSLCADAVSLSYRINEALNSRRRQQLLSCAVAVLKEVPHGAMYTPILRFFEIYLAEADCKLDLFCDAYYDAVLSLFINHFSIPEPLELKAFLPPRADSILRFLLLPARIASSPHLRSLLYQRLFISLTVTKSDMHIVCYVVPFLGRVVENNEICFHEVVKSFSAEAQYEKVEGETQVNLLAFTLSILTNSTPAEVLSASDKRLLLHAFAYFIRRISFFIGNEEAIANEADVDSDEEEISVSNSAQNLESKSAGVFDFCVQSISTVLSSNVFRISFVESTLDSVESCARLALIINFLRNYDPVSSTAFLNAISLHRSFVLLLWHNIISLKSKSLFSSSRSLLSILENGDCISANDEVLLIPMLSLFVTLFSNILTTTDDDDFLNGGHSNSMLAFDIEEIISITGHFRDLALGLIDMAYPVTPNTLFSNAVQSNAKSSKWSEMFKQVTLLTKMLHERDCRLHFMPENYWSSHNRQVVISSSFLKVGQKQRRARGRPFEFVRLMLRGRNIDEEEEPPSAMELRNISILLAIPFVLRFIQRVEMFTEVIMRDKAQSGNDSFSRKTYHITVHRGSIYEDAFAALSPAKVPDLRNVLRVQMMNWSGLNEAGIDGGGIFREFMSELLRTVVDPARGFFTTTHDQLLYPNPLAMFLYPDFHDHFYFIGRIIAKLIYEGLLADLRFADFFVLQWLSPSGNGMLDLQYVKSYDPLVYANLKYLKYCSSEEVDGLDLDFSVLVDNLGVTEKVNLKRNGGGIRVTVENRTEYIGLYVNFFLSKRIAPMLNALRAGVRSVIDIEWLRIFSPAEISMLIGGVDSEINFEELREFTTVHNIQSDDDKLYIESFWMILNAFPNSEKKKFLKFVTGCPRPPLMGFKALNPPMGIQLVHQETDRLPTAGTCMNLLKLPVYTEFETLSSKLHIAINAGAGFELS